MAEEILSDSFPDLKELENKVGRKTPESLLIWMRDAADCEDGWRSDVVDRGDSALRDTFSDKISSLKQEMKWLRSADVRILRQLVAVHEGIEAMRWLIEERDTLASRGSSLTGSLSSLVTVEDHGPSMSPCRESPTQDLTETTGDESAHHPPHTDRGESNHKSCFDSTEERPEVTGSTHDSHGQASSSPANGVISANLPKSQPPDLNIALRRDIKSGADTIRRALLRSSRARREVRIDAGSFVLSKQSEETQTEHPTEGSVRAFHSSTKEEEERAPKRETILLGYDAQWCWVESQDDVTFL